MKSDSGRRWLIAAVGLFLLLLGGWVLLALQLNIALAGPLPFAGRLTSNLRAEYGLDDGDTPIGQISLSIDQAVQAVGEALGLSDEEAARQRASLELAMSQPVPTATALNFEGLAPFTATPTDTSTAPPTEPPAPTASRTPKPPTETPKPTKTPEKTQTGVPTSVSQPTDVPTSVPTDAPTDAPTDVPTAVPTAAADTKKPVIDASGAEFSPPPGDITTCTLTVSNVHITDAVGSSGISDSQVGIKYTAPGGMVYLYGMTHTGGFQPDTSWDAYYSGTFTLTNVSVAYLAGGRIGLAAPSTTYQHLDIYVFARDNEGNFSYYANDFDYHVYVNCP